MRAMIGRRGWTTIELMVVVAIGGIVSAGIATVLNRQQRFFTSTAALVEQRVSLRDATAILPSELRALAAGDVLAFSDTALDLRATIGSGIVCDTLPSRAGVVLVPITSDVDRQLTAFATTPQPGDIVLVYDARADGTSLDDRWRPAEIANVTANAAACAASPLIERGATTAAPTQLRWAAGSVFASGVLPGSFVRLLRRVRYRFYRSGSGEWYLGYAEWSGSGFGAVQPVSGPYAAYTRASSGLTLRYVDEAGTPLTPSDDPRRIARVTVTVRGAARGSLVSRTARVVDTQTVSTRPRNR